MIAKAIEPILQVSSDILDLLWPEGKTAVYDFNEQRVYVFDPELNHWRIPNEMDLPDY